MHASEAGYITKPSNYFRDSAATMYFSRTHPHENCTLFTSTVQDFMVNWVLTDLLSFPPQKCALPPFMLEVFNGSMYKVSQKLIDQFVNISLTEYSLS